MSLLEQLTIELGLPTPELERIISSAPKRYKTYPIPKRTGGFRIIAQPSRELKQIQRYLLHHHLARFPVHPSAMAYARGRNISENASAHRKNAALLKLDFVDFFGSIKAADWRNFLNGADQKIFDLRDIADLTRILFFGRGTYKPVCLSIGAPTSPAISNILLFNFDEQIAELAATYGVTYTRYADDITISGPSIDVVLNFESAIKKVVKATKRPNLKFNNKKRGVYGPAERRLVTGLVITPTEEISIGRARKRLISALLHRFSLQQLDIESQAQLKGLLGFAIANEPAFVGRLRTKYGDNTVDSALSIHILTRAERSASG